MLVQRALKIRLYPTQEQANYLNQVIGNSRFIFNQMLNERINYYNEHKDNKEDLYFAVDVKNQFIQNQCVLVVIIGITANIATKLF